MTDEQVGKYIRLLCAQHLHGHLTEKQVLFISKSYDNDIMLKFKKDDAGNYYNERLEFEINKRKLYSESRSINKKGKVKSLNINNINDKKHKKIISKSYDNDMGNGNEIENINKNIKEIKEKFEIFRKKYKGTKRGFIKEFETFSKHSDYITVVDLLIPALDREILYKDILKKNNLFCPQWKNLQTWINNRCWEQEFEIIEQNKPVKQMIVR